jgi:hypothetical protein
LPYYFGTVLRLFHLGLVDSIKAIFVSTVILSAVFMYLMGRELAGEFAGFISAIFYTIAPYRLVNLYVRGSIGESLCLAIFPLLMYLSIKLILKPSNFRLAITAIVLALLILAHNITAIIFLPLYISFLYSILLTYYEDIRYYSFRYFLPLFLLGLGLSAYFFVPALFEKQYLFLSQTKLTNLTEHFIKLPDFFTSAWSYDNKPSFQLGWAHIIAAITVLTVIFISNQVIRKKYYYYAFYTTLCLGILLFFTNYASYKFWQLPPFSWIDFPWRLMNVITFFMALATIFLSARKFTRIIAIVLAVLILIFSGKYVRPKDYINKGDDYYATNDGTTTSMDELMPVWVKNKPQNRYQSKVESENGSTTVLNLKYDSKSIKFDSISEDISTLKINTVYFPGWSFSVDGKNLDINYNYPDGLIRLSTPVGKHKIIGVFKDTPVRFFSNMITLISIFTVIILLVGSVSFKKKNSV